MAVKLYSKKYKAINDRLLRLQLSELFTTLTRRHVYGLLLKGLEIKERKPLSVTERNFI